MLENKFNVKGKTKKEHHDNLTYSVRYPTKNHLQLYNGETGRTLTKELMNMMGKNINSHMFKHSIDTNHPTVSLDDFTVFSSGYSNRKFTKKVSESLFIRHNSLTLNNHGTSVPLMLFN